MNILRVIAGLVVGLALGVGIVAGGEMLNHMLWPPPAELQVTNPEAVRDYLASAPLAALLGLPLVWTIAAGAGAFAAAKIAGRAWAGWVVGALLFAATMANLFLIPHPLWMLIASVICVPLAAYWSAKMAAPRAPA